MALLGVTPGTNSAAEGRSLSTNFEAANLEEDDEGDEVKGAGVALAEAFLLFLPEATFLPPPPDPPAAIIC